MVKNYLKFAIRNLLKNKTTSFINIIGLSVGMTAAVLILIWVQNEFNFDHYHHDSDKIYRVTTHIKEANITYENSPLLLAEAAKNQVPEVETATKIFTGNWPIFNINGNYFYEKKAAYVDTEWFNMFKYNIIDGNVSSFNQNPLSIILTESASKKYFNNRASIGKTIRIDSLDYKVQAIIANNPSNSSLQFDSYIPIAALLMNEKLKQNDSQWNNYNYITFVKINSKQNEKIISQKIKNIFASQNEKGTDISLMSLKEMHFDAATQNPSFLVGNRNTTYIFGIIACLLLLIACINYVNLTTAKSSLRAKEVSVRKIIGANKGNLIKQFIVEYVLMSCISLVLTLILIQLFLPTFNIVTGKHFKIPITSLSMWQIIGFTFFIAFLLNSIYPAMLLSAFKPLNVFRGKTILNFKDINIRKGLVIFQFTISVILIASTIIIYKQMQFIQSSNPGYDRAQVMSFGLPPSISREKKAVIIETFKNELMSQTGIEAVSAANQPPVNIGSECSECADWEGRNPKFNPRITQLSTDEAFLKVLKPTLVQGRWFEQKNIADKKNVILNETAINEFNIKKPVIGQRFVFKEDTGQIVGVIKDIVFKSMHEKNSAMVIFNNNLWYRYLMVRIAPNNIANGVKTIESIWKKHFPETPLEFKFLDDTFNELYTEDLKTANLILFFALIAIFISALGLFALSAFMAEQRTKEIGIRKVLGAAISNIIVLISKDFILLVGVSIALATPIAWWLMNIWLENYAYRINISWYNFLFSGIIAIAIALLTVSYQAIKAALINPVKSLKTE